MNLSEVISIQLYYKVDKLESQASLHPQSPITTETDAAIKLFLIPIVNN